MSVAIREQQVSLDVLAAAILDAHATVVAGAVATLEHAIRAGELLLQAREQIRHGQWHAWLADTGIANSHDGRSYSTLYAYMRIARYKDRVREEQPVTIQGAVRALRGADDSRQDKMMVETAQALRARGLKHAEIAEQMGIPRGSVSRLVDPAGYLRSKRKRNALDLEAKRALRRKERDALARRNTTIGHLYADLRKLVQAVDQAHDQLADPEVRRHLSSTMDSLHRAEDHLVRASRGAAA